jgi:hypothetical protein
MEPANSLAAEITAMESALLGDGEMSVSKRKSTRKAISKRKVRLVFNIGEISVFRCSPANLSSNARRTQMHVR